MLTSTSASDYGRIAPAIALANMPFDFMFYDVLALTLSEREEIYQECTKSTYHEGGMFLVAPVGMPLNGGRTFQYYSTSKDLCDANPELADLAVPGVGSSPMGAAAFARQVANVLQRPVVGVVAGCGVVDVISEGLGGWFFYGMHNRVRATSAFIQEFVGHDSEKRAIDVRRKLDVESVAGGPHEEDANTVLNIMINQHAKLKILAGHSKGALILQRASELYVQDLKREKLNPAAQFVTFGCGVELGTFNAKHHLGRLDLLGQINTPFAMKSLRPNLNWVEGKMHTLVRHHPFHMPVDKLLP